MVVAAAGAFLYLQRAEPPWWARLWYPLRYSAIVRGHAANYHLNPALLAAVIEQESKFNPDARSSTGAVGLMQLQPATAEGIAIRTGGSKFRLSDLTNPEINVRYGAWYLRHLLDKYHDERTALAALQRRPGERRPLAGRARRGAVRRRRARTSPASSASRGSTAGPTARSSAWADRPKPVPAGRPAAPAGTPTRASPGSRRWC